MYQAVGPLVLGGSVFREIGCQTGDYGPSLHLSQTNLAEERREPRVRAQVVH